MMKAKATDAETIATLRQAIIVLAASNAWKAFGECRAYDKYGRTMSVMDCVEVDSYARLVLDWLDEQEADQCSAAHAIDA